MDDLPHLLSLFGQPRPLDRRAVVKATLTVGFCAAVTPVWAQVVHTSDDGLVAGEVKVPVGDQQIPAYHALPAAGGPFPIVVVVHEVFGVHEHIKDICRRFARIGYYAIAPDLFARQGDAAAETDIAKLMTDIVSRKPDAESMKDIDQTFAFAAASGSGDRHRAAIVGFCWGGRQAWLYAASNPALKAAVAWYGPLGTPKSDLHPANPPDIVGKLKVPVLGLYGGQDKGIPMAAIEGMRKELAEAGGASKIIVYGDAGHAFFADYRSSYVKADADASWGEATAWLKAHGA